MTKVFVVVEGDYTGETILGVFTTMEAVSRAYPANWQETGHPDHRYWFTQDERYRNYTVETCELKS